MPILFDIDGTLIDQRAAEQAAAAALLGRFGRELRHADVSELCCAWRAARERHLPAYLAGASGYREYHRRRVRDVFLPGLTARQADQRYAVFAAAYRREWRAFPDVWPCLRALGAEPCAVLSNGHPLQQRRKLRAAGLLAKFEHVFVSRELPAAKPDGRAFRTACRRAGWAPQRCICVGDRLESDARAAARAGLLGVWLNRGGAALRPDVPVIRSLAELPRLVRSIAAGAVSPAWEPANQAFVTSN